LAIFYPKSPCSGYIGYIYTLYISIYPQRLEFLIFMKLITKEDVIKEVKEIRDYESELNKTWGGKTRILKLIPSNLVLKFERAEYMYKKSIRTDDYKKIIDMCDLMYRAYSAIIASAELNGYEELDPEILCFKYNKNKYALIVGNDFELQNVYEKYKKEKDCIIFSIEELFRCIPEHCIDAKEELTKANLSPTFERIYVKK